jgi:hypothetical protein
MNYYRLIFKKEDGKVFFSDIIRQEMSSEEFQKMKWDQPILRHEIGDHVHFISLDSTYLDCILLGVSTYQSMS